MVSIRFTSFAFALMFLLLLDSAANTHQAMVEIEVAVEGGSPLGTVGKDVLNDVPTAREANHAKIGGRKMMKRKVSVKEMAKDAESMNGRENSKVSGATHSFGKCSRREKLNLRCGRRSRLKVSTDSFMSLNADYHPPKPHPPKNN